MQGTKNLTEGVISRQLFNLAMPIMGTSFIQMAYSITDMAWVGRLGSEAVAAIGAVGILTWMTNSISYLNKVGSEVSVGQSIGAQNVEDARGFASHNLTIALILSLCWGFLLFVLAHPIIGFYKLEEPIALNAVEYLRIVASAFPFIFLSAAFTGIHNAAGLSKIPFYISGTGLLLNMVLDPLFILGFHLGTAGAGWVRVPRARVRGARRTADRPLPPRYPALEGRHPIIRDLRFPAATHIRPAGICRSLSRINLALLPDFTIFTEIYDSNG